LTPDFASSVSDNILPTLQLKPDACSRPDHNKYSTVLRGRNIHHFRASVSISTFGSLLQRARHGVKRDLELRAQEKPNQIGEQAAEELPRLVNSRFPPRSVVPQDLPSLRVDQPPCGGREAPRKAEGVAIDMRQYLLGDRSFLAGVVHRRRHVESQTDAPAGCSDLGEEGLLVLFADEFLCASVSSGSSRNLEEVGR